MIAKLIILLISVHLPLAVANLVTYYYVSSEQTRKTCGGLALYVELQGFINLFMFFLNLINYCLLRKRVTRKRDETSAIALVNWKMDSSGRLSSSQENQTCDCSVLDIGYWMTYGLLVISMLTDWLYSCYAMTLFHGAPYGCTGTLKEMCLADVVIIFLSHLAFTCLVMYLSFTDDQL